MNRYIAESRELDGAPEYPNGTWCIIDEHSGWSGSVIIIDLEEYEAIEMADKMNKEHKEGFTI
tara:strand:- start:1863 stop:2051 length:189 start_codon:yes stop_codon:yes gene_type:complete